MLTVDKIQIKAKERETKEAANKVIKARNRALRGKVGFAKLVWKDFSIDITIFE
jgi:hypothetical protein